MLIPNKFSGYRRDGIRLYPGGKGQGAQAPDPKLVEAQLRSMGIQDQAIQQILKNSEDLAPIQKAQMQFGLDASKKAYEQSQEDRVWSLGKRNQLDQAQKPLIDAASNFSETGRRAELAGKGMADVEGSFSQARAGLGRDMARMGLDPNSGRVAAASNQTAIEEAKAKAAVGSNATTAARAEGMQLKSNVANMLSGFPAMAAGLTNSGASLGSNGLTVANTGLAGMNSGYGAASAGAGQMGNNATGMYSAQGNFNIQNQNLQNTDPLLQVAGAGLGAWAGGGFKMPSDINLKEDISPVDSNAALDAIRKIPVASWKYKPGEGDGGEHVGPMAQDVQAAVGDKAAPGGKMIDLITMNGITMSAIKALDSKINKLIGERGVAMTGA